MPSGSDREGQLEDTASACLESAPADSAALTAAYASGAVAPIEAVRQALERAAAIQPDLNAFCVIDQSGALAAAERSAERWAAGRPLSPLDGVPVTVKDIVRVRGLDLRYGSLVTEDVSALDDAPSIANLRRSGAVILGLTNTPEFGWKAVTDSPRNGPTRNPWAPWATPGGSSGGAAVAAATGAGFAHLGTDGGGSIRIPAAFTGIVGHKPTFGRVPAFPSSVFGTVAHIGPMARNVGDAALMLNALSGLDGQDWFQPKVALAPVRPAPLDLHGLRLGYWTVPPFGAVDPQVGALVDAAVGRLAEAGALIDRIDLPMSDMLRDIFHRHWFVGAAVRLAAIPPAMHSRLDPGFVRIARQGDDYSAIDRMTAELARAEFGTLMDALLTRYDFIVSPAVAVLPFEAGQEVPAGGEHACWIDWAGFSYPINLSQQPAASVPCGRSREGLPVGLQIIGARGADEAVLSMALTWQHRHPEFFLTHPLAWPRDEARR